MANFVVVTADQVVPKNLIPSETRQMKQFYDSQVEAIRGGGEALLVEIEDDDNPLTIRSRVVSAAKRQGMNVRTRTIERDGTMYLAAYEVPQKAVQEEQVVPEQKQAPILDEIERIVKAQFEALESAGVSREELATVAAQLAKRK